MALRFYRNCGNDNSKDRKEQVQTEFEKFKAISKQNEISPTVTLSDFCKNIVLRQKL